MGLWELQNSEVNNERPTKGPNAKYKGPPYGRFKIARRGLQMHCLSLGEPAKHINTCNGVKNLIKVKKALG